MSNIRTVLAVNMKARRKELKLSQAELAEKIGTSPNYISKIYASITDIMLILESRSFLILHLEPSDIV